MTGPEALPEGLSVDDLVLGDRAEARPNQALPAEPEHVHPSAPQPEDHGFGHTHSDHHPVDHPHEIHHLVESQPTWQGFVDGWELGLYRDAVLAGALAAAALSILGVFIVLRRAVFASASIGQAAGLGVVAAFYAGIHWGVDVPPLVGAFASAVLATALLALRTTARRLPHDALLGFGFLVAAAGAVALGDRVAQEAHEVSAILFGTAVVVSSFDVMLLAGVFLVVVLLVFASWRGIAFSGFDPEGARVQQLPVRVLDWGFWLLVAATVAITTRVLGALPVFAFSVLPPLGAILSTRRLARTLPVAGSIGAVCASAGYVAAYFMALPVGATQALCAALVLGLTLLRR